jgi:hypothetical protein
MIRTLLCTALSAAILIAPAMSGEIADTESGFRFTVPDTWESVKRPIPGIAIIVASPDRKETGGNCNVLVLEDEATKSMTQAEIETRLTAEVNEQFWKTSIAGAEGLQSMKIDKWGDKTQRGRKVFYLKATNVFERGGKVATVTQLMDMHIIPGRGYFMTCTALATQFDKEASTFETIMASFEPMPETFLTVRAPTPWVATRAGHGRALARAGSEGIKTGIAGVARNLAR